jgi:nuclear pore complex protein Nup205
LAELVAQSNYLSLFLDAIRSLPLELRDAQGSGKCFALLCFSHSQGANCYFSLDTSVLLAYYESLLSLLQQLSCTKSGAIHVLKSGLFEAVRDSQLFAADPDIGIG